MLYLARARPCNSSALDAGILMRIRSVSRNVPAPSDHARATAAVGHQREAARHAIVIVRDDHVIDATDWLGRDETNVCVGDSGMSNAKSIVLRAAFKARTS